MTVLVSAIIPVVLVALVGVWLGRCFDLNLQTLARVNIYALLPALILTSLTRMTLETGQAIAMIVAFLLTTAILYGLAAGVGNWLRLPADKRVSLIATVLFANVGNLGLPFILFALGEAGLERAVLFLIVGSLLISSIFPILLKGRGLKIGIRYAVGLPVFWAVIAGVGLRSLDRTIPIMVERALLLMGEGVIPLALLTLGIQLSRSILKVGCCEWMGAGLRLVASPGLAYGIGFCLGLRALDLQVLTLQAAMPVAVSSVIWMMEVDGDVEQVSRTIVLSTLISLVTLPVILLLTTP